MGGGEGEGGKEARREGKGDNLWHSLHSVLQFR